jgi:hypothetical protein
MLVTRIALTSKERKQTKLRNIRFEKPKKTTMVKDKGTRIHPHREQDHIEEQYQSDG